jgi:GNAT superfamily N-acetyltransferase
MTPTKDGDEDPSPEPRNERVEDRTYPHELLPRELEIQVLAFVRIVWPDALVGDERFRSRMWDVPPPTHFVRSVGDLLVSHAQVFDLEFAGDEGTVRIGGVGAVMTYPQFRREGHGSAVMRRAAEHIEAVDDVGVLFCAESNVPFYSGLGWSRLEPGRVVVRGAMPDDVVMAIGDPDRVPTPLRLDWSW